MNWTRDAYSISDEPERLQPEVIVEYLARAYWSNQRPRAVIEKSLKHSLCFGVYEGSYENQTQIGFARVVSDHATFAYLADVFILESHQGHGLGKWLVQTILEHPDLQGLRRWMLATRDAHGLYAQFGFVPLENPDRYMTKFDSNA
jgi:GNAT superfamily N-acetyltransferase